MMIENEPGHGVEEPASPSRRRPVLRPTGGAEVDVAKAMRTIAVDLRPPSRIAVERARERRDAPAEALPVANRSVAALAHMVEARIVEAAWTLARLPDRERGWLYHKHNGLSYVQERPDRWANAVDPASGREIGFGAAPPRPGSPTPKQVSRWAEALAWLQWLSVDHGRVVFGAALSRRGDMMHRISWVKARQFSGLTVTRQRLAAIYNAGIADIAAELVARG